MKRTSDIKISNKQELVHFYNSYFEDDKDLNSFIEKAFDMDWDDRKPRRMINQIMRFVTLSQSVDSIIPSCDGLRILFLKICMESLNSLDESVKTGEFYAKYAKCFSKEGTEYILNNFILTGCYIKDIFPNEKTHRAFTIEIFLKLLKYIRNRVVHDGIYWDIQLFARNSNCKLITSFEANKKDFSYAEDCSAGELIDYHFETSLQFDRFIYYFTEAGINYVKKYMETRNTA